MAYVPQKNTRVLTIVFFLLLYSGAWVLLSQQISKNLDSLSDPAISGGIRIISGQKRVKGYPFIPTIQFSGELMIENTRVVIPEMTIKSFFIPQTPLFINLPQGFSANGPNLDSRLSSVERLEMRISVPAKILDSTLESDAIEWRRRVGAYQIKHLELEKNGLFVRAKGFAGLDQALQPNGKLSANVRGYADFISWMQRRGIVSSTEGMLATMALNGLAEDDPIRQEKVLEIDIVLEDRLLNLGPVRVARLPAIRWDRRM